MFAFSGFLQYYVPMVEMDRSKERLSADNRIILFIGPEGSGKTMLGKRLAEELELPYITTGGILRDLAKNDEGLWGDECREMFLNHNYLDGETLLEILVDRFGQDDTKNGFVLDGGLRTLQETVDFQAMLEMAGCHLPISVMYLKIPEEISYERLVLGEKARKRDDDTFEGVKSRLSKFAYQLEERLEHIEKEFNWVLVEVDVNCFEEEAYFRVRSVFK